jgi:hypothetical protein
MSAESPLGKEQRMDGVALQYPGRVFQSTNRQVNQTSYLRDGGG